MKNLGRSVKKLPTVIYKQSTNISPQEAERRVAHAFDVLFEEKITIRGEPTESMGSSQEVFRLEREVKTK